jgi:ABC-type nitrate/sulfonate/bicarbonate transport system substrate-binding protein
MHRLLAALFLAGGVLTTPARAEVPTIRVGWTIPAEEAKYWMMRRPAAFPDLGKSYRIEWSQFQGTSVMSQALIAGALDCATQGVLPIAQSAASGTLAVYIVAEHVGEKPGSFSVYWAVKEESPIRTVADLKGRTVGISIIGGGTQGPFDLMLRRNGVDPGKDIKRRSILHQPPHSTCYAGDATRPSNDLQCPRASRGRRPDELWSQCG